MRVSTMMELRNIGQMGAEVRCACGRSFLFTGRDSFRCRADGDTLHALFAHARWHESKDLRAFLERAAVAPRFEEDRPGLISEAEARLTDHLRPRRLKH